ncbi:hypothetical protein HU200_002842 [Digitaria exilis]|uniref:Peptidase A1 domain-containing protein n=1 Tax=Digitaria exilis TaxID=1010633 RepID=A0A835FXI3_9POAL|nr:hypothetical protein HU200_002842 [Digitaria exilis]
MVVTSSSLKPSKTCSGPKEKDGATLLPLTHRHGPCSPSISKEKPSLQETLHRDQLRAAHIHAKVSGTNGTKDLKQSAVTIPTSPGFSIGTAEYVITVGVGTPAVSQVMNIDTGSDVSWVQCAPCAAAGSCYSQKDKLFDPTKSSTYTAFTCSSAQCAALDVNGCSNSQCQYIVQYGDGSVTTGTYGSDTLSLTSSAVVNNFQFGCSHRAAGFVGQTDGLMALGGDTESLVSQTSATYGKAFSYCLPRPSSSAGFLTLGAALPPTAYEALREAFRKEMKAYPAAAAMGNLDTCFNFDGFDTIVVPKITLTFSRGAVQDVDASGILFGSCLAFTATGQDGDTGILGNVQQRTFEVLFDVGGRSLGFRSGAC